MWFETRGTSTPERIARIEITTTSSIRVKPRDFWVGMVRVWRSAGFFGRVPAALEKKRQRRVPGV
jgi:hypothetical protein